VSAHKIKGPASSKETNPYCAVRLILKTFFTELKQGKNVVISCRTTQTTKFSTTCLEEVISSW